MASVVAVGPRVRFLRWLLLLTVALTACGSPGPSPASESAAEALDRGIKAHAAGKLDEATAAYFETLAKDPMNKFAYYNLGQVAKARGRLVTAEAYYRLALEQDPKMASALLRLAAVRYELNAYQEAVDLNRRVIAIEPNNAAAHFNLALALRALGQNAEAQQEFATAQGLDPSLVRPPAGSATPVPSASPVR